MLALGQFIKQAQKLALLFSIVVVFGQGFGQHLSHWLIHDAGHFSFASGHPFEVHFQCLSDARQEHDELKSIDRSQSDGDYVLFVTTNI